MLLSILLICCCAFVPQTAHAETTQQNIKALDLEKTNEKIDFEQIKNEKGIITDIECVKNNKETFIEYINNTEGNVLIPDRNENSNVLAYQITDIDQEKMNLYPVYLYNKVEKSQIDYQEVFNETISLTSSATEGDAYDFMSTTAVFFVYSKNYWNKYLNIATIKVKVTVDYYPVENATYDYYVGKYEVYVCPNSKWKFQSFVMSAMQQEDYYIDEYEVTTNNEKKTEEMGFSFNIGENIHGGTDGVSGDKKYSINFDYGVSVPDGTSSVSYIGTKTDDGYKSSSYSVKPADKASKGASYSGLIYVTYRMPKTQNTGLVGLTFRELAIWGQIAEPSYSVNNSDSLMILAAWSRPFNNKTMMAFVGDISELKSGDKSDQYLDGFDFSSSLPVREGSSIMLTFTEN